HYAPRRASQNQYRTPRLKDFGYGRLATSTVPRPALRLKFSTLRLQAFAGLGRVAGPHPGGDFLQRPLQAPANLCLGFLGGHLALPG
ncbi:MAG TPA: hypothetical protein VNQ81_17025, partial [Povalibacter sp.]|nr:hypothetical protein [Povalibacter sp.]